MDSQNKLFELLTNFTVETVQELIAPTYKLLGHAIVVSEELPNIIIPIADRYFSQCEHLIESRDDPHINERFDEMKKVSGFIALLPMIITMTTKCIHSMDLKDIVSTNYNLSMQAVGVHLRAVVKRNGMPRMVDERPSVTDLYINTESGLVKLSTL